MNHYYIDQLVRLRCPSYKNGKMYDGIITKIKGDQVYVRIGRNSKSTVFHKCWILT